MTGDAPDGWDGLDRARASVVDVLRGGAPGEADAADYARLAGDRSTPLRMRALAVVLGSGDGRSRWVVWVPDAAREFGIEPGVLAGVLDMLVLDGVLTAAGAVGAGMRAFSVPALVDVDRDPTG